MMVNTTGTFSKQLSFLWRKEERPADRRDALECEMRQFRGFLHDLPEARPAAQQKRGGGIERHLRKVMARTERVASTVDRDSMVW